MLSVRHPLNDRRLARSDRRVKALHGEAEKIRSEMQNIRVEADQKQSMVDHLSEASDMPYLRYTHELWG